MLTEFEKKEERYYGKSALESVKTMRGIIADFENPACEMTWGEFSRAMHRALNGYDYDKNKLEAIYNTEFKRMFCDDEEDEDE